MDRNAVGQQTATGQKGKLYEERKTDDLRTGRLEKPPGGRGRPARCNHVVVNENAVSLMNGIYMHFDAVRPIFEVVLFGMRGVWEFPMLSHGYKTGIEASGERASKNEAARLDTHDFGDTGIEKWSGKRLYRMIQQLAITQYGGDILELNAGTRKIRDGSNGGMQPLRVLGGRQGD